MIINVDREPELSLYYLGGIIIKILKEKESVSINSLLEYIEEQRGKSIHIDFVYYALDWLYLLNIIKLEGDEVRYDNKELDCA